MEPQIQRDVRFLRSNRSNQIPNSSQRINELLRQLIGQVITQDEDIQAVKEIILENIKQYQDAINTKTSEQFNTRQKKTLINKIKQCGQLKALLQQQSQYPIQLYALNTTENNYKFVTLFNESFYQDLRSVQQCIQAIESIEDRLIVENLQFSDEIDDFLQKILFYLQDCIFRKCKDSLFSFIEKIREKVREQQQEQIQARAFRNQILSTITVHDIICLMLIKVPQKFRLAYQLYKTDLPIPIYFEVPNRKIPKQINYFQLLQQLILVQTYQNVILNIGGSSTQKSGKSQFISKLYFIQQISGQYSGHFKNCSIEIHSNLVTEDQKKRNLVIDVNGSVQKSERSFIQILQKLLCLSNVIIFHIHQNDLQVSENNSMTWVKQKYSNPENATKKFVIMVHQKQVRRNQIPGYNDRELQRALMLPLNPKFQQSEVNVIRKKIFAEIKKTNCSDFQALIPNELKTKIRTVLNILEAESNKEFPFTNQSVGIYQLENQIYKIESSIILYQLQQGKNIYNKQIQKIEELNTKIEAKKAMVKSQSQLMKFIRANFRERRQFQALNNSIKHLKNSIMQPIEQEYKRLTAQLVQLRMMLANTQNIRRQQNRERNQQQQARLRQYKLKQKRLIELEHIKEQSDYSIQSIYLEMILSDQILQKDKHKALISNIYMQSFNSKKPCNLINGKTLTFGNIYLEEFMEKLDKTYSFAKQIEKPSYYEQPKSIRQKYQNAKSAILQSEIQIQKKLFVISVIGTQSSAKSTLLNYLFGCSFATASGRCTKGVYYTIVQTKDKIIIILDTEGLLSLTGRDQTFDIQITSLIFKISDLVIINNKGQVNSVTKNLLGVCMYVLKNLMKKLKYEDKKKTVKLLFALRDQCDSNSQVHTGMLANILNSLSTTQNSQRINFTDYFIVSTSDIYMFSSAISLLQKGVYFKQKNQSMFGKSILVFRSKILDYLEEPKYKTFKQFYQQAKTAWKSILKCGTQIFNFQSIFEIEAKKQINRVCKNFQKQIQDDIKQLNQEIQSQNNIQNLKDKEANIRQTYRIMQQTFQNKVKQEIRGRCQTIEWVNHIIKKYQQNFARKKNYSLKIFKYRLLLLKIQKQQCQFSNKIKNLLNQLNETQTEQVQKRFSQSSQTLLKSFEQQIQNKQSFYALQQTSSFITRSYWHLWFNLYASYFVKNFSELNKYLEKSLKRESFIDVVCFFDQDRVNQFMRERAFKKWVECIRISQAQLGTLFDKIKDIGKLQNEQQIFKSTQEITWKQYNDFIKNCGLPYTCISTELPEIIYVGLIDTIPQLIKRRHRQLTTQQLNKKVALVQQTKQRLKKALTLSGRLAESAQQWLQIINQKATKFFQQKAKQMIAMQINVEILSQMGGDKILIKATNQSLLWKKQGSQKDKWINCYKFISNVNYFLRQFFYSSSSVGKLKLLVQNLEIQLRKQYVIMIKQIKDILRSENIEKVTKDKNKNQFLNFLSKNMFGADLVMYNKRSIDQLKKIVQQLEKILNKFNEREYFSTIYKNMNLIEVQRCLKQLLQAAEKQILGCQSICPICHVKCCLGADHQGGHRALQNSHTLICFAGYRYSFTGKVCKEMCFSTFDSPTRQYKNHLQFMKAQHPKWAQHFQKDPKQNNTQYAQLLNIWANLKDMLMKYAFCQGMQDDQKYDCVNQPLTEQDMQQKRLDQTKQKDKILSAFSQQPQINSIGQYQLKNYKRLRPDGSIQEEQNNQNQGNIAQKLNGLLSLFALLAALNKNQNQQGQGNQGPFIKVQIKKKQPQK